MKPKNPQSQSPSFEERHHISVARLTALIRALGGTGQVIAIDLMNRHLDRGETVEQLFEDAEQTIYRITVSRQSKDRYQIRLGCCIEGPEPGVGSEGDGGEWTVHFTGDIPDDIEPGSFWLT